MPVKITFAGGKAFENNVSKVNRNSLRLGIVMKWICGKYQADPHAKGVRKGMKYMDQWIDRLHQLLIVRLLKGLGLIPKYVQNRADGIAGLELSSEPVG